MPKPERKNRKAKSKITPFSFVNDSGETVKLSLKQKLFCEHYVRYRGNGVQSARAAGYKGNHLVLASVAYENLIKPHITDYIRFLLKREGLTDEGVDKELLVVIRQDASLAAKVRGIQEYNKMRGRHAPDKVEVEGEFRVVEVGWSVEKGDRDKG